VGNKRVSDPEEGPLKEIRRGGGGPEASIEKVIAFGKFKQRMSGKGKKRIEGYEQRW